MTNHPPVSILLEGGAARPRPWLAALTGFTMVLVPALLLQHGRGARWLDLYQQTGVLVALAAVVAWFAGRDVARLFSLQQGRAMDEIVQAGYTRDDILEALGWQAGRRVLAQGWPAVVGILAAGVLATPHLADLVLIEGVMWILGAACAAAAAVWIAGYVPERGAPTSFPRLAFEDPILYREAGRSLLPTLLAAAAFLTWALLAPDWPAMALATAAIAALQALGQKARERETRTEEPLLATPSTRQEQTAARLAVVAFRGWIPLLVPAVMLARTPQGLALGLLAPLAGGLVGLAVAEGRSRQQAFGKLALWVLGAGTAWVGLLGGVIALATWRPSAVQEGLLQAAPAANAALVLAIAGLLAARRLRNPSPEPPPGKVAQSQALTIAVASAAATALVLGLHGAAWLSDLQERTEFALVGAGVAILFVAPALALLAWVGAPLAAVLGLRVNRVLHALLVGAVSGASTWAALLVLRVLEFYHLRPSTGAFQSYQPLDEPIGLAALLGAVAALAVSVTQAPPAGQPKPSLRRPVAASALRAGLLGVLAVALVQAWLLSAASPEQVPQNPVRDDAAAYAALAARERETDGPRHLGDQMVLEERYFASGHPSVSLATLARLDLGLWRLAKASTEDLHHFLDRSRLEVPVPDLYRQALESQGARAAAKLRRAARPDGWLAGWYTAPVARLLVERELRVMARDLDRAAEAARPLLTPGGAEPIEDLAHLRSTPFAAFLDGEGLCAEVREWRWRFTQREMLRAAAAARLHRLEKGRYPARLADLVPEYLPQRPRSYVSPSGELTWRVSGRHAWLSDRDPLVSGRAMGVDLGSPGGGPYDYMARGLDRM